MDEALRDFSETYKYFPDFIFFMDTREKILDFIRIAGPIIPVKLAKQMNTNILMASAFLSELTASGKLRTSNLKIGGTPLYYIQGQEAKLQSFSNNIGAKEKIVYDMLAVKKVVADNNLAALERVALKEMRDFAVQFSYENNFYWRWFLVSESDAVGFIKESFVPETVLSVVPKVNVQMDVTDTAQMKAVSVVQETLVEPAEKSNEINTSVKAVRAKREKIPDYSFEKVLDYFKENNIVLVEKKGKKNDAECIVKIPSKVGDIICYCRAKFKKNITDGDISAAYIQAQYKGQPLLFLYSGELSKKANEMLAGYPNIIIKKI